MAQYSCPDSCLYSQPLCRGSEVRGGLCSRTESDRGGNEIHGGIGLWRAGIGEERGAARGQVRVVVAVVVGLLGYVSLGE